MKHLGDITKISGYEVPPVDCVIGGSPCQDLSQAGLRKGLAGERSGLFLEQIRIIKEMREADVHRGRSGQFVRPRYAVWENVPGALSSGKPKGADFGAVLTNFVRIAEPEAPNVPVPENGWPTAGCLYDELGRWSVAWRIQDAQFWGTALRADDGSILKQGTPQRRRRIALVADLGGLTAPEILFEREGLSGHPESIPETRQETAGSAGEGTGGTGPVTVKIRGGCSGGGKGPLIQEDRSATLSTLQDQTLFQPVGFDVYNMANTGAVSKTLNSVRSDTDHVPVVMEPKTYDTRGNGGGEVCCTITGDHENRVTDYTSVVVEPSTFAMQAIGEYKESQVGSSLKSRDFKDATDLVAGLDCRNGRENGDICGTLQSKPNGGFSYNCTHPDRVGHIVRRLTPGECELLQGFPKGWTDIGDWVDSKGKKHKAADSPRYKALGNSICLPPWKFVLKRICAQYERDATMASLFDGIGGFPLLWEQLNGKGTCIWASEIEEFPMAVTKARIGE